MTTGSILRGSRGRRDRRRTDAAVVLHRLGPGRCGHGRHALPARVRRPDPLVGPRRLTALTALTLLAGLASTIFAPLTATLLAQLGWRAHLSHPRRRPRPLITIPAHLWGLRGPWPDPDPDRAPPDRRRRTPRTRSRAAEPFLLLIAAVALGAFTAFAVVVNQVPLLIERGMSTTACGLGARASAALGQVLGRFGYRHLVGATTVRVRGVRRPRAHRGGHRPARGSCPAPRCCSSRPRCSPAPPAGCSPCCRPRRSATAGAPPTTAASTGLLSAPALLATALAPWAGAALAQTLGGYPAVFGLLAGLGALAAVLAVGTMPDTTATPDLTAIQLAQQLLTQ